MRNNIHPKKNEWQFYAQSILLFATQHSKQWAHSRLAAAQKKPSFQGQLNVRYQPSGKIEMRLRRMTGIRQWC
jgi:hypothetical protein